MYAGAGETQLVYNDPTISFIDTDGGGGVILLPMGYTRERFFNLAPIITVNTEFELTQFIRARKINVKFSAEAGVVLTLWENTIMSSVQFVLATRNYLITDTGAYTLTSWWDGEAWNTQIVGPDNV